MSSRTSSGIRSATARSSAQSVRQPRWPSETATTAAARVGRRERVGRQADERRPRGRPRARARASLPDTTNVSAERAAAASCSVGEARAQLAARVVGDLVAIPAPVPELGRRAAAASSACASGHCTGWKMTTARRSPPSARSRRARRAARERGRAAGPAAARPRRRARAAGRPRRRRRARSRSRAWSREDEPLERPGQQQQGRGRRHRR